MGKRLVREGLVKGRGGNLSLKDKGFVYFSPSGYPLDCFSPGQSVKVRYKTGRAEKGELKPSCEMPLHLACYKKDPGIRTVIHLHPPCATALACSGKELRAFFPEFAVLFGDKIPLVPYSSPGSDKLAEDAAKVIGDSPALFMENPDTGVKHEFNLNPRLNDLLIKGLKQTGQLKANKWYDLDYDNQVQPTEKNNAEKT